jgi:peptidyl-prolyl cis-trans isomerase B (cyclophilin B)
LSSDPNRSRPRSSKKRRAVQPGASRPTGGGQPPGRPNQGGSASGVRGGSASSGLSTASLAAIAVVVFAIGAALAGGAIKFGSGASPSSDVFGAGGNPAGSGDAQASTAPSGSNTGAGIPASCPNAQPAAAPAGSANVATIDTPKGAIEITLKADLSPIAVGNFLALASCGYYDNVVFHRVVPNFVIQGGDGQYGRTTTFDASRVGSGGPGYEIQDEPVTTLYSRGTVAMARTAAPNSVGSQFFIVLSDDARSALAGTSANTYQIIGSVTKGMEVADAITTAAAGVEIPAQPIPMTKVTVGQAVAASPGASSPPTTGSPSPSPS